MKGIGKTQAVLHPRISAPCLITNLEYVELPNLHFFYTWRASLKIGRHSPYVLGILRQVYISPTNWNSILGALGSRSGSKKGLRRKESLILESCCISFHRESTPVSQLALLYRCCYTALPRSRSRLKFRVWGFQFHSCGVAETCKRLTSLVSALCSD